MKFSARSEQELLGGFTSYKDRFRSVFPTRFALEIDSIRQSHLIQKTNLSTTYLSLIESLIPDFTNQELSSLIFNQFISLERQVPLLNNHSLLTLDTKQYETYNILCNVWGKLINGKYPYFFLTGSAGTGKTFMLHQIISYLSSK